MFKSRLEKVDSVQDAAVSPPNVDCVVGKRPVGRQAADQLLPQMVVRVDEAWAHKT